MAVHWTKLPHECRVKLTRLQHIMQQLERQFYLVVVAVRVQGVGLLCSAEFKIHKCDMLPCLTGGRGGVWLYIYSVRDR